MSTANALIHRPVDYRLKSPYPARPKNKPVRRNPVTIAAGFRCLDGIVLCSDSEHTAGQSKFYEQKIFEIKANNALLYLAGAGDYVYIRTAAEEISKRLIDKDITEQQAKKAVEKCVSKLYGDYLLTAQQGGSTTATVALMLSLRIQGEPKAMLYRVGESGGLALIRADYMAIGTDSAESVFREQADLLFRSYMSVFTVRHLGPYIISRVAKFSAYCGGSPQVACLSDDGMSFLDNSASAEPGPDYLSDIFTDLPDILESCISPSTESNPGFENLLKRFAARVSEEREAREKQLGGSHPFEHNGWSF